MKISERIIKTDNELSNKEIKIKGELNMEVIKNYILVLKPGIVCKSETMEKEYKRILSEFKNGIINIGEFFDYEIMEVNRIYLKKGE